MQSLIFSFLTVGPVFTIIAFGVFLRKIGVVDRIFASRLSVLVFRVFLPALLMGTFAQTDFLELFTPRLLLVAWGTMILTMSLTALVGWGSGLFKGNLALLTMGSTWGNVAIIGFALGQSVYGEAGFVRAGILSAILLPVHTLFGIVLMELEKGGPPSLNSGSKAKRIIKNPVIIASLVGIVISSFSSSIPQFPITVLDILGRASLPVALIAIGASLDFSVARSTWAAPVGSVFIKLMIMPIIGYVLASFFGLNALWTGSLLLAFSCPTAISFFVVSSAVGYDSSRGAAIVTATTIGSAVTTGLVVAIMKTLEYV